MFKYCLKPTEEKISFARMTEKTFIVYYKFTHNLNITIAVWGMWIYFNEKIYMDSVCEKVIPQLNKRNKKSVMIFIRSNVFYSKVPLIYGKLFCIKKMIHIGILVVLILCGRWVGMLCCFCFALLLFHVSKIIFSDI